MKRYETWFSLIVSPKSRACSNFLHGSRPGSLIQRLEKHNYIREMQSNIKYAKRPSDGVDVVVLWSQAIHQSTCGRPLFRVPQGWEQRSKPQVVVHNWTKQNLCKCLSQAGNQHAVDRRHGQARAVKQTYSTDLNISQLHPATSMRLAEGLAALHTFRCKAKVLLANAHLQRTPSMRTLQEYPPGN